LMVDISTVEGFNAWQLQVKLVTDMLAGIETGEKAVLEELGWPLTPIGILDVLEGKAPSPKRFSTRDRARAKIAMHALLQVDIARDHVQRPSQQTPRPPSMRRCSRQH
jgi:hypothetical protein